MRFRAPLLHQQRHNLTPIALAPLGVSAWLRKKYVVAIVSARERPVAGDASRERSASGFRLRCLRDDHP
jgi:hypothetical protein